MKKSGRYRRFLYPLILFVLLALALVETWALARRPWWVDATIGGADSALLGEGFYTKETSREGTPFRWTMGEATILLPWSQPGYRVILGADTAVTATHPLQLVGCGRPVLSVDVQPGFHYYHFAWDAQCARSWPESLGGTDIRLVTEARQVRAGDDRSLGLSVSELHLRSMGTGAVSLVPFVLVALAIVALDLLLRPWNVARMLILAGAALGLPVAFDLLAWHPPVGTDYTWLPQAWLPGLVVLILAGLVLVRAVIPVRYGALAATILVGLVFVGLLLNLAGHWAVTGPDYAWHLNHGGSWERVFRAHGFYPFGLPLVLWLGQLAGDPLLAGQWACRVATVVTFVAAVALAWRLSNGRGAWLSALVFLGSPFLVAYGVLVSTDALMMAPAMLALLVLGWSEDRLVRRLLLAGLLLGLAYLFRHQALVLLVAALIWALGERIKTKELPQRVRWLGRLGRFLPPLLVLAGFLIGSAPQWVLDVWYMGRPFYSQQYVNIWYFAYRQFGDPPAGGLWALLNFDPGMLWRNWMANLRSILSTTLHGLLTWPLGLVALFGLVGAVLEGQGRRNRLLLLWVGVYAAAVTLTVNKERFFLPIIPALVVLAALFLARLWERLVRIGGLWGILAQAVPVALWCWVLLHLVQAEGELALYGVAIFR